MGTMWEHEEANRIRDQSGAKSWPRACTFNRVQRSLSCAQPYRNMFLPSRVGWVSPFGNWINMKNGCGEPCCQWVAAANLLHGHSYGTRPLASPCVWKTIGTICWKDWLATVWAFVLPLKERPVQSVCRINTLVVPVLVAQDFLRWNQLQLDFCGAQSTIIELDRVLCGGRSFSHDEQSTAGCIGVWARLQILGTRHHSEKALLQHHKECILMPTHSTRLKNDTSPGQECCKG